MNLPMCRVEIVGLKTDLTRAVGALQALGTVQIEAVSGCPEVAVPPLAPPEPDNERERDLEALAARLDRLCRTLPEASHEPDAEACASVEDARAGCAAIAPDAERLLARCRELAQEASGLVRYRQTLAALASVAPVLLPGYRAGYFAPGTAGLGSIDVLEASLASAGGEAEVTWVPDAGGSVVLMVTYPPLATAAVADAVQQAGLAPLPLPDAAAAAAPDVAAGLLDERLASARQEQADAELRLRDLSRGWSAEAVAWRAAVTDELECYRVRRRFGETAAAFVLIGWVPEAEMPHLSAALEAALDGAVSVRSLPLTAQERGRAPVALHNPRAARPFESLTRLVSLPSYGATDPTVLMAIFLPVFSGMMLGDIGYGALLLVLSLWLRRRVTGGATRDLLSVLGIGAAWAIGFGLLYGELFGTLGTRLGLRPIWGERTESANMTALLGVAVAIGVLHVSLGLVLGIREALRRRSRAHLLERAGMLIGLMASLTLMGVAADVLPRPLLTLAAAGLVLGVGLLAASIGWLGLLLGPIEFIGLIGNVLSYLRIAAIGLASALLAEVANDMAGLIGNLFVGIAVSLLIHGLNLVLGAFSPTIHSLRLHYVEFFRKFYEGGGSPYRPFRATRPMTTTANATGGLHGR